jgi:hypothetical protein
MNVSSVSLGTHGQPDALRQAFDRFVGETFYGQMIGSMRKMTGKPAYFHGGRAEEVFQSQFDQTLAERLAASNAHSFTGPMFRQFLAQTNPGAANLDETLATADAAAEQAELASPPWAELLSAGRR